MICTKRRRIDTDTDHRYADSMSFVVDASARARVLVTGPGGPSFLHRLTTQHVKDLVAGDARLAVLTTDKGRIVDVVHHVVLEEGILLLGTRLDSDALCAWLDRYFFTENLAFAAIGSGALVVDLATAEKHVAGASALVAWAAVRKGGLVAVRTFDRVDVAGAVVPAALLVSIDDTALPAADTDAAVDAVDAVAAGVPGVEIGEAHTPLDLELHDAIHWSKGCYIGQEVIARLDTYGKQRKRLMSVVVDAATQDPADNVIAIGDTVVIGGVVVGAVTSTSTAVPGAGLAMVKLAADVTENPAVVRTATGEKSAVLKRRHAAQQPHD